MARPDWKHPSSHPNDSDEATKAFFKGFNVNAPEEKPDSRILHNRWGQIEPSKSISLKEFYRSAGYGLEGSFRCKGHRIPKVHTYIYICMYLCSFFVITVLF